MTFTEMDDFLPFICLPGGKVILPTEIILFQSLNHQEGNLKVPVYSSIVPNPFTTLIAGFQLWHWWAL